MNAVFDPSVVFVDYNQWREAEFQQAFLHRFLSYINIINDINNISIYFTNDLHEKYLLCNAHMPPYIKDPIWRNQFIPIIYRFLNPRVEKLNAEEVSPCDQINPIRIQNDDITIEYLKTIHIMINRDEKFYLCFSAINEDVSKIAQYRCKCHERNSRHITINSDDDLLENIDNLSDLFYPSNNDAEQIERFRIGLNYCSRKYFRSEIINNYQIANSFIDSILGKNNSEVIMRALSKRLVKTHIQACQDQGLKDEEFVYKGNLINRFRVSEVGRVHYSFEKGAIVFLEYFGVGEYDDAYKK